MFAPDVVRIASVESLRPVFPSRDVALVIECEEHVSLLPDGVQEEFVRFPGRTGGRSLLGEVLRRTDDDVLASAGETVVGNQSFALFRHQDGFARPVASLQDGREDPAL
jgi:hypothetical protein